MAAVIRRLTPLALGVVALAAVWLLLPSSSPPLYDGVCFSDPYRYLTPASGQQGNPLAATHVVAATNGLIPGTQVFTGETPAQAQIATDDGTLKAPGGTVGVTITIKAVPPPATKPSDGTMDGNVYSITASAQPAGQVNVNPSDPATISLRPTLTNVARVVERWDGDHWTRLQTQYGAACAGIATATSDRLGDFVLVVPGQSSGGRGGGGQGGGGSFPAVLVAVIAAVVILVVVVVLIRVSRARAARAASSRSGKRGRGGSRRRR